jgi:hypothetical protein
MTHSPCGASSRGITITTTTNPKGKRKKKRLYKHVRSKEVERELIWGELDRHLFGGGKT